MFCDLFTPKAPTCPELAYLGHEAEALETQPELELKLGVYGRLKSILVARGILPERLFSRMTTNQPGTEASYMI